MTYSEFWVKLLSVPEYEIFAEKAITVLVRMPSTYLRESGFSSLSLVKKKKRNCLTNIDPVMRMVLESEITPNY